MMRGIVFGGSGTLGQSIISKFSNEGDLICGILKGKKEKRIYQ